MVILNAVWMKLHAGGIVKGGGMVISYQLTHSELHTMSPPIVFLLKCFPIPKAGWKEIGRFCLPLFQ